MIETTSLETKGILKGKMALIKGAASGIGRATAILFAQEGAAVSIVDINEIEGLKTVQTIEENGGRAIFICCNMSKTEDCQQAAQQILNEFKRVDILFNNVGVLHRTSILETSEEEWDLVHAINLKSAFLFSKALLPSMIANGGGVIVNSDPDGVLLGGTGRLLIVSRNLRWLTSPGAWQ
jgi:NAD(P)-dependent dehydrogenase (short-subunit alcohol dehydrogenase family)